MLEEQRKGGRRGHGNYEDAEQPQGTTRGFEFLLFENRAQSHVAPEELNNSQSAPRDT